MVDEDSGIVRFKGEFDACHAGFINMSSAITLFKTPDIVMDLTETTFFDAGCLAQLNRWINKLMRSGREVVVFITVSSVTDRIFSLFESWLPYHIQRCAI
ncbi:MAG: STAS domain-containing protein [Patescibacteria group bacterium]